MIANFQNCMRLISKNSLATKHPRIAEIQKSSERLNVCSLEFKIFENLEIGNRNSLIRKKGAFKILWSLATIHEVDL